MRALLQGNSITDSKFVWRQQRTLNIRQESFVQCYSRLQCEKILGHYEIVEQRNSRSRKHNLQRRFNYRIRDWIKCFFEIPLFPMEKQFCLSFSLKFCRYRFFSLVDPCSGLVSKRGTTPVLLDFFSTFIVVGFDGLDEFVECASITGFNL